MRLILRWQQTPLKSVQEIPPPTRPHLTLQVLPDPFPTVIIPTSPENSLTCLAH